MNMMEAEEGACCQHPSHSRNKWILSEVRPKLTETHPLSTPKWSSPPTKLLGGVDISLLPIVIAPALVLSIHLPSLKSWFTKPYCPQLLLISNPWVSFPHSLDF